MDIRTYFKWRLAAIHFGTWAWTVLMFVVIFRHTGNRYSHLFFGGFALMLMAVASGGMIVRSS